MVDSGLGLHLWEVEINQEQGGDSILQDRGSASRSNQNLISQLSFCCKRAAGIGGKSNFREEGPLEIRRRLQEGSLLSFLLQEGSLLPFLLQEGSRNLR